MHSMSQFIINWECNYMTQAEKPEISSVYYFLLAENLWLRNFLNDTSMFQKTLQTGLLISYVLPFSGMNLGKLNTIWKLT